MILKNIIPPHYPTDQKLLQRLVTAYEKKENVSPVTLVDKYPICGSHRITAAKKVFPENTSIDQLNWFIISKKELFNRINKATFDKKSLIKKLLYCLGNSDFTEYRRLLSYICPLLDEPIRQSLLDQDGAAMEIWW